MTMAATGVGGLFPFPQENFVFFKPNPAFTHIFERNKTSWKSGFSPIYKHLVHFSWFKKKWTTCTRIVVWSRYLNLCELQIENKKIKHRNLKSNDFFLLFSKQNIKHVHDQNCQHNKYSISRKIKKFAKHPINNSTSLTANFSFR